MAATIHVGDRVPQHTFPTIPYAVELEDLHLCGTAASVDTEDWKGKKVVVFSVPGAFTPTCHVKHLPGFLALHDELKAKGVDVIAVLSANDVWVMSAWLRTEGVQDKIVGLTDLNAEWSRKMGLDRDLTKGGLGIRTARYAMVLDDLVVQYLGVEPGPGVSVSGAEAVLAKL